VILEEEAKHKQAKSKGKQAMPGMWLGNTWAGTINRVGRDAESKNVFASWPAVSR
jgi:hypothetical protein